MAFFAKKSLIPTRWGPQGHIVALKHELESIQAASDESPTVKARLAHLVGIGGSGIDDIGRLLAFRADCESQWGSPVTQVDLERLRHGELFAIHKALALSRLDRTPDDVTEGFVMASGSVDGIRIEPREVFWQRFRPVGKPNGRVVVISPRYGETGRQYYDSIYSLNKNGFDVVIMDHQWAGQTQSTAGGLDRGFGVARDVAAVTAFAQRILEREYEGIAGAEVLLVGKAMGASAGVLAATVMNDNDLLRLDGRPMPTSLNSVLLTPWLGATSSVRNRVRQFASRLPVLGRMAVQYGQATSIRIDSPRALRQTLHAVQLATPDLRRVCKLIEQGRGSQGRVYVIHCAYDPFVDPDRSAWLTSKLGEKATLRLVDTRYVSTTKPLFMTEYVLDGLNAIVAQGVREREPLSELG